MAADTGSTPNAMTGIEEAYCNSAIRALIDANGSLLRSMVGDAVQNVTHGGKSDTLKLDATMEITIADELKEYDQFAILITEERGEDANPLAAAAQKTSRGPRTFFVSDPVDRSSQLSRFLSETKEPEKTVGEIVRDKRLIETWEEFTGGPAGITGATSAITCVRRGLPILSAILNIITQELTIACGVGIFRIKLSESEARASRTSDRVLDLRVVRERGVAINFPPLENRNDERNFVTFLGKTGYEANLKDSGLFSPADIDKLIKYREPGGPARALYLSDVQPAGNPVGFVYANGEKIGEWIHWLPFLRFATTGANSRANALRMYEIAHDRPHTKDGILMSTSHVYSVFTRHPDNATTMILDVDRLKSLPNPSKYRSTLLLARDDNQWARTFVQLQGHRPIAFATD